MKKGFFQFNYSAINPKEPVGDIERQKDPVIYLRASANTMASGITIGSFYKVIAFINDNEFKNSCGVLIKNDDDEFVAYAVDHFQTV